MDSYNNDLQSSAAAELTKNRRRSSIQFILKWLHWLTVGAQPTDTCRAILSYKGVMYMNHLNKGVAKGAMTQEQAQAKFDKWMEGKAAQVAAKVSGLDKAKRGWPVWNYW